MPIMGPLSDMLGISRQTATLAFQFGDGLSNLLWSMSDIVVICGLGGISAEKWWKWFMPLFGILFIMQMIFIEIAVFIGW